ncbi:MAG: hypothetical protein PHT78_10200 [Desulfitobacteriaceae bacterium]|nr:hypothetical protein [Desulfitobacteriaceae bacterium]MDD4753598.1 hypothetical protein [Desulfitobacteriaceae bacterium]
MGINIFETIWAVLNLVLLIGIPLGIIYAIIIVIRSIKGIIKRLDSIEEQLKKLGGV